MPSKYLYFQLAICYTFDGIFRYTLDIEAVSCDEMYVNLHDILVSTEISVEEFVRHIREEVQDLTRCPCSAGVGANRYAVKLKLLKRLAFVIYCHSLKMCVNQFLIW